MQTQLNTRRVLIYIAFAYGIAWLVALVIYLSGGIENSREIVPGLSVVLVLTAVGYMGAPALANVLTRIVTKEGWKDARLKPHLKRAWPYWLAAWFLPGILTALGAVIYFLFFPDHLDLNAGPLRELMRQSGVTELPMPAMTLILLQGFQALLISPLVNGLFTFGEEFGWRAYLLPKLTPLGVRKALLLSGPIWGAWHWPLTAMGHNYGLGYPGAPWLGMLTMVWFTTVLGIVIGWLTLRGNSVWPAVIAHAAINGIGGIAMFITKGPVSNLIGPAPTGWIGSLAFTLLAAWILLSPAALKNLPQHAEDTTPLAAETVAPAGEAANE